MLKLMEVQAALKAPKGQFNKFGGYKYRSCEDILEAVKPHLAKAEATITISDEIVLVGERFYVKATATFTCSEGKESVSAYAREAETKKGMDESQITGSASSYARKYALNGLLCIDDTKDADATNDHGKAEIATPANTVTPNNVGDTVFQLNLKLIHDTVGDEDANIAKFCKKYGIGSLSELTPELAQTAVNNIKAKRNG